MADLSTEKQVCVAAEVVPNRDKAGQPLRFSGIMIEELISIAPGLNGFLGLKTHWDEDGGSRTVCLWSDRDAVWGWRHEGQSRIAKLMRGVSIEQACSFNVTDMKRGFPAPVAETLSGGSFQIIPVLLIPVLFQVAGAAHVFAG